MSASRGTEIMPNGMLIYLLEREYHESAVNEKLKKKLGNVLASLSILLNFNDVERTMLPAKSAPSLVKKKQDCRIMLT